MVFRRSTSTPNGLSDLVHRSASTGLRRVKSAPAFLDKLPDDCPRENAVAVVKSAATEALDSVEETVSNSVHDDIFLSALVHVLMKRWSGGWEAETFYSTAMRFAISVVTHHVASVVMAKAAEAHVCIPLLTAGG